jgi:hypothetical protein
LVAAPPGEPLLRPATGLGTALDVALPDLDGDCLRTEDASNREPTAAYQHNSNPPRVSQMRVKVAE